MSKRTKWDTGASDDSKKLPIYQHKASLQQAVKDNAFLVVTGETGSGKTTQLPQYLHQAGFWRDGKIGLTQPRRVAAITVAQRVSQEMHCSLGREVGYQVRFDDCTSEDTVVKYLTDGCLLREILADPVLSQYSVVVLDEAHERSLNTDILLGLLKQTSCTDKASKGRSVPLKVVVMSATLETDKLSVFLGGCPVFTIPGRTFPVISKFGCAIGKKDTESTVYLKEVVKVALDVHTCEMSGDILVFLTGQFEIEKACDMLYEKAESIDYRYDVQDRKVEGLLILPLYGSMPTDQQKQIFQPPPPGIRKCVVATNIAATSLTINGIKYIVDSGFVKQLNHNSRVNMDILEVVPISKSEAQQRAGRAGRTSAGKCFRIYNQEFWEKCMPDYTVPEIQRTSLTSVILTLKCLGVHDVIRFPYLDRPEERFIMEALKQLYQCDAIDRRGKVTPLGELMVEFPLPPGLTRALLQAASLGCEDLLLPVAAMLSVENIFIRPGHPEKQKKADQKHKMLAAQAGSCNDFTILLSVFEKCKASDDQPTWCKDHYIHWRALKSAFSVETQLREILLRLKQRRDFPMETFDGNKSELFRRCLCTGYFTNVARRSVGKGFCTMDGHGSMVQIHPSSTLFDQEAQLDWVIFHDVLVTSRVYIRTVCPVRYDWVKDLLPKLHEVDVYDLSNVARQEVTDEEMAIWETKEAAKRKTAGSVEDDLKKLEKRNDESSCGRQFSDSMFAEEEWNDDPEAKALTEKVISRNNVSDRANVTPKGIGKKKSLLRTLQALGSQPKWSKSDSLPQAAGSDSETEALPTPHTKRKKKRSKRGRKKVAVSGEEAEQKDSGYEGVNEEGPEQVDPIQSKEPSKPRFKKVKSPVQTKSSPSSSKSDSKSINDYKIDTLNRKQWRNKVKNKKKCKNKFKVQNQENLPKTAKAETIVQMDIEGGLSEASGVNIGKVIAKPQPRKNPKQQQKDNDKAQKRKIIPEGKELSFMTTSSTPGTDTVKNNKNTLEKKTKRGKRVKASTLCISEPQDVELKNEEDQPQQAVREEKQLGPPSSKRRKQEECRVQDSRKETLRRMLNRQSSEKTVQMTEHDNATHTIEQENTTPIMKQKKTTHTIEQQSTTHTIEQENTTPIMKQKKTTHTIEQQSTTHTIEQRNTPLTLEQSPTDRSAALRSRMELRLESARFRYINEVLYTTSSGDAKRMFRQDPQAFGVYHKGFTAQVKRWPVNPVDAIISYICQKPASLVVADFGCGDCKIAHSVKNEVHSFDFAPISDRVTVCDMANVPLENGTVDIAVFCLSLMGTNLVDFLLEANRVLVMGGILKISEVASRFDNVRNFLGALSSLGFKLLTKETENSYFYSFDFEKIAEAPERAKKAGGLELRPCMYKKR
ncbi:hypothetical protein DPEC_G00246360 [Dallia pectoralis]|uniref:Uncharacterized protein n=1 Tax=Dallia pectoralis TaxID=75939 RepID=A0ACC2FW31_DALPE|nr:hypothetical protein DPEC_G00246360 [Dallia pectoralis]